jgi:hemerythrin-like metal-binding protein
LTVGLLEWKDEYRMGIADIDRSHEELIGIINGIYQSLGSTAGREGIQSFLDQVYVLASDEFYLEEQLMKERRFEGYDDHRADHERMLKAIRQLADTFNPVEDVAENNRTLGEQLGSWFGTHFRTFDARLHQLLRGG